MCPLPSHEAKALPCLKMMQRLLPCKRSSIMQQPTPYPPVLLPIPFWRPNQNPPAKEKCHFRLGQATLIRSWSLTVYFSPSLHHRQALCLRLDSAGRPRRAANRGTFLKTHLVTSLPCLELLSSSSLPLRGRPHIWSQCCVVSCLLCMKSSFCSCHACSHL